MVKLRLMRMGKKKQPHYRVVAADSRSPRNGRFIEIVGTYDARQDPSVVNIDNERALHWLRNGAQATERVQKLLSITGAWQAFKGLPFDGPAPATPAPTVTAETAAPAAATETPTTEPAAASPVASEAAPAGVAADQAGDSETGEGV